MLKSLVVSGLFSTIAFASFGQNKSPQNNSYLKNLNTAGEKIFYIPNRGTVETTTGKVVLGKGLICLLSDYDVPEVELDGDFFDLLDTSRRATKSAMHFDYGVSAFDRMGNLLYHPYWFDNGPDYWEEGRRRFVENEKMGLVNRLGERLIPARDYSTLTEVHGGYLLGCRDCIYFVFDTTDTEHGAGWKGDRYDVLDRNGKLIKTPTKEELHDVQLQPASRRYTNPAQVKALATQLYALPETRQAEELMDMPAGSTHFVCYDEPSATSPYYHYSLEDTAGSTFRPPLQLLVSEDGKTILHLRSDMSKTTPYEIWRKEEGKFD